MFKLLFLAAILTSWNTPTQGARILAMLTLFARSHYSMFQPLLKTIAQAGHEVVVYSPFPLDSPQLNYTDVHLKNIPTNGTEIDSMILEFIGKPNFQCMDNVLFKNEMFNQFVENEEIKKLLTSTEKFDLIISEPHNLQEYTLILSHIFKAPVIALQAFQTHCILKRASGSSLSVTYQPDICHPFSTRMTLMERLYNSYWVFKNLYNYYQKHLPTLEGLMRKHFPDMPPLLDLMSNVSLTFVNGHSTALYSEPLTPNIIPVAGIHLAPEKPLPQDLKIFMDEASEGVIYFSLGTYIPDDLMPQEYFNTYIDVFKNLSQKVLWKTRRQAIKHLPSNVKLVKWAPQQDILAHPNCVLFVTHGGQLSLIETIHYAVPVVSVPYIYDQHKNAKFYEAAEVGVKLNLHELNTQNILEAIQTVLNTPKYKENMKRLSEVFKDRPLSPADSVVYWTEYVLRHGGARHLRPASAQLSWYQLALLDVLALIVAGAVSLSVLFYIIVSKIILYIQRLTNITNKKSTFSKKLQ